MSNEKVEQVTDPIAMAMMEGNEVTLAEAGMILESVLKHDADRDDVIDDNLRKMDVLIGHAGEGKTAIIDQVLTRIGAEKCVFHMGSTVEEDNNGLPFIDTANAVTRLAKPEHVPCFSRKPSSPSGIGVLVVEECLSGGTMHQNFLRSVIDRYWPNGDRMCDGWKVIGTTNPETAEYSTVKAADRALASRMRFVYARASSDEKMKYWAQSRMGRTVFNFLLVHHTGTGTLDPVDVLDSRSWYGLADKIECMVRDKHPNAMLARAVRTAAGTVMESHFIEFLKKGNNPDEYPVEAATLLYGTRSLSNYDEDAVGEELARVGRWTGKGAVPLLGATKWSVKAFLGDEHILKRLKDDNEFYRRVRGSLSKFLVALGDGGYAEMAEDTCEHIKRLRDSHPRFIYDVLDDLKGTNLEPQLIRMDDRRQQANKDLAASAAD
jgi:hypothetical protein